MWAQGFAAAFSGLNIVYLILGTIIGLVVGALPGLGPLFGVSIMLPFTFGMPTATALIMLSAVHASTAYGDSLASILINTPGGASSVATCWDGYPLAQQGKAKLALGVSAMGSLTGGLIGWLSLVLITPVLMEISLRMGPAEYFMLAIMAISLLAIASAGETTKGLILGGIGLMLAFVGTDPIVASRRMSFGVPYLEDGIPLVPVAIGLFALAQAMRLAEKEQSSAEIRQAPGNVLDGVFAALRRPVILIRSGVVGILMGIMPVLGISTANIVAYMVEKRASKDPDSFGKGSIEGLLAPETARNACVVGDLIPTLSLGIPGSSTTALFLAALMIHGVQPGADFFQSGSLATTIFAGVLLAQFTFFILGILFAGVWAKVVYIPRALLVPLIGMLCFTGVYSWRNSLTDVLVAIVFGFVGYVLGKREWPLACLLIGLVLGAMAEANFHRAMLIGKNNPVAAFSSPISLTLLVLTVMLVVWPYVSAMWRRRRTSA